MTYDCFKTMTYYDFIRGLRLRHFSAEEIISYGDAVRNGVANSLPEEELWANILEPLWVLDSLRSFFDQPIRITSTYRSPDYNRAVGGASRSRHLVNNAIDFKVEGVTPMKASAKLNEFRSVGMFQGGIGTYATFTHLDTRGENRTW